MHVTYEFHSTDPVDYDCLNEGSQVGRVGLTADEGGKPMESLREAVDKALSGRLFQRGTHRELDPGNYLVIQRPERGANTSWIDGWSWHVTVEVPPQPTPIITIAGEH